MLTLFGEKSFRTAPPGAFTAERRRRLRYCADVGVIIDISDKLTLLRRARRLAKDVQRTQLRMAVRFVEVTEDEVRRQMLVLCDRHAKDAQVEEAIAAMPLLTELLAQRQQHLRRLEAELFDAPAPALHDG